VSWAPAQPAADVRAKAALLRRRVEHRSMWMWVDGPSMGESIFPGSEVLVRGARRPRLGEVWVFYDAAGKLIVHRHVWKTRHALRFQGDLRVYPDPPIGPDLLVGAVRAIRKDGSVRTLTTRDQIVGWCKIAARAGRLRLEKLDPRRSTS
jgi:hypothetical protein